MIINPYVFKADELDSVIIGTQTWTNFNLNIDDGLVGIDYPNDDIGNVPDYGLLYSWVAAVRVAATISGWRLPTKTEFLTLQSYLGADPGGKMKETGTTYFNSPNTGATNSSGYNGRGAGYFENEGGSPLIFKDRMFMWTSTNSGLNADVFQLIYTATTLVTFAASKLNLMSVRLIKE